MPKVKILVVKESIDRDEYTTRTLVGSLSDWEEVSEEDVKILKQHSWLFSEPIKKSFGFDFNPYIVFQDEVPIAERIKGVHVFLENERKHKEREEAEKQKRLKRKKKLQEIKERELFKKLKEKYK